MTKSDKAGGEMSELAERARELVRKLDALSSRKQQESLIENVLLAERRLAKLEDAEIAHGMSEEWTDRVKTDEHTRGMADGADFVATALRAAAEKDR